jgi:hypothetical protein
MLKSKSVEFSLGKLSSSDPGPAQAGPSGGRPDQSGVQRTGILARVSAPCRNIPAGRQMSGLQHGPTGLTTGPSGLHFGGAKLTAEFRHELLPTARFPPPFKYPFS